MLAQGVWTKSTLYYFPFDELNDGKLVYENKGTAVSAGITCQKNGANTDIAYVQPGALGSLTAFCSSQKPSIWIGDGSASLGCSSKTGFTISFWINVPSEHAAWKDFFGFRIQGYDYRFEYSAKNSGDFQVYYTHYNYGDKNLVNAIHTVNNSKISTYEEDKGNTITEITADGSWQHIALVFSPSDRCSIYVGGKLVNTMAVVNHGDLQQIIVGSLVRKNGAIRDVGTTKTGIDELAVFDFVATEEDVQELVKNRPEIFVSYDIEVGKNSTVISENIDVDKPVFNFALKDSLSSGLYKVAEIKGDRSFDEEVLERASKPDDGNAYFFLANGNKEIYCAYANGGDHVWIGKPTGDLCTPASWWPEHQSGGHCFIDCPVELELNVSGNFTPASLTFGQNSKAVVIGGKGKISDINWGGEDPNNRGIDAITNLSDSVSHTINVPVYFETHIQVKQAAHSGKEAADRKKAHITFAGGAYPDNGWFLYGRNEPEDSYYAYSRVMFGAYYLDSTQNSPWVVDDSDHRVALAENSSLYVPYVKDARELFVERGAVANMVNYIWDTSENKLFNRNHGTVAISNLTVKKCSRTLYTVKGHNYNDVPSVFKIGCITNAITSGAWFVIGTQDEDCSNCTNILFVGEGGLRFEGSKADGTSPVYSIGYTQKNALTIIRPWYSDFEIAQGTGSGHALVLCRDVEFNTNDEEGKGRTITVNAAVKRNNGDMKMIIAGSGTLQMNNGIDCDSSFSVAVSDKSTLALGDGVKFPMGKITVSSTATLEISESGIAEIKSVDFKEGSTLSFNFSQKDSSPKLVVYEGSCQLFDLLSNVRIGGIKPCAGDYTLMTVNCSDYAEDSAKVWQAASGSADWVGKVWLEPVVGDSGSINAVSLKMRRKVGFALYLR